MFPGHFFCARFFAPRYFPKVGAAPPPFLAQWQNAANAYLGPLGRTVMD
jgi:hypothetical protein